MRADKIRLLAKSKDFAYRPQQQELAVAVAEALVLGVKAGLDPQMIYDVVRVSTGASLAGKKMRNVLPAPGALSTSTLASCA